VHRTADASYTQRAAEEELSAIKQQLQELAVQHELAVIDRAWEQEKTKEYQRAYRTYLHRRDRLASTAVPPERSETHVFDPQQHPR
jgi:hypothetical protein